LADLEAAWLESLAEPGPAAGYLAALAAVPDGMRGSSAVSLLLLLLEATEQRRRHADTLEVVRALHPYRQQKVDLRERMLAALSGLHGGEPWFELFVQLADLRGSGDLQDALERFQKLARLLPGCVVSHRSGWGEGLIAEHALPAKGFHVDFRQDKSRRFMPFTTGLDVLAVLEREDLRARLLVDLPGLQQEAEE